MATGAVVIQVTAPAAVVQIESTAGTAVVVAEASSIAVVTVAEQGPPGASGSSTVVAFPTTGTVSEYQAVSVQNGVAAIADASIVAQAGSVVGIAAQSTNGPGTIDVQINGTMTQSGWSFQPGPVFLGSYGALTQTPPTAPGYLQILGSAIAPQTVLIDIQEPLILTT